MAEDAHHDLPDRFPGHTGPASGAMTFPTSRSTRVLAAAFSDDHNLAFRCRAFISNGYGTLTVDTEEQEGVTILVTPGINPQRIDRIYSTGSDATLTNPQGTAVASIIEIRD
jgi:hypothetical protein